MLVHEGSVHDIDSLKKSESQQGKPLHTIAVTQENLRPSGPGNIWQITGTSC